MIRLFNGSFVFGISLVALMALIASPAWPTPLGTSFTYQAYLSDSEQPANGVYDLQFALYTVSTDGSAAGTVSIDDFTVVHGLISASLDFTDLPFNGQALWIEVRVRDAGATGNYTIVRPRHRLHYVPFALYSLKRADLGPLDLPLSQAVNDAGTALWVRNTGEGPGLGGDSAGLDGVYGQSTGMDGFGVYGRVTQDGPESAGVYGTNDQGPGVWGKNFVSTDGSGIGVFGQSADPSGAGVWGNGTGANAAGVYGVNYHGAGVWGDATGGGGSGVYGYSADGAGVRGVGTTAMRADGDAVQSPDGGGWIKAMIAVDYSGVMERCYNSQAVGAYRDGQGCGIQVAHVDGSGEYTFDFPFDISQTFPIVTTRDVRFYRASVSLGPYDDGAFFNPHRLVVRCGWYDQPRRPCRFILALF